MKALIESFTKCPVLVVGDYMLDEYIHGSVERISPEAPVPVVVERERKLVPGGAGNVVRNLRALGAPVFPVGLLGNDEAGELLTGMLKRLGAEPGPGILRAEDRPTTRKTRILAGNQQVCRLDREAAGHINDSLQSRLCEAAISVMDNARGLIFSDYDKGVILPAIIERLTKEARDRNLFVAVDPQVSHFHTYLQADVLTPNHHEAGRFLGRSLITEEQVEAGGREILERLSARMLLITRGEKGMSLFESDGSCRHFPTQAQQVFDVTGAGDTVISVFTLAMAAGAQPEQAVRLSNHAAGLVVGQVGAAVVSPEELLAMPQPS